MHRAFSLLLVACLAVFALAAPAPKQPLSKRFGNFKVPVRNRQALLRNPAAAISRAYSKFSWQIVFVSPDGETLATFPPTPSSSSSSAPAPYSSAPAPYSTASSNSSTSSAAAEEGAAQSTAAQAQATPSASGGDESGEVTASPESNDSEYLETVKIGGQSLTLDFDTGSSDLWVFSTQLPSSDIGSHTAFNPSKSSTWSEYQGGSWMISYGDGSSASGTVGFDTVDIGGATVDKQAVEIATQISSSFVSDTNNDGLVGLGFSIINTVQPQAQKTFFENIMGDLDLPVFTADLADDASGSYEFGKIDSSKYTGAIHYTDVDSSNGFWQFDSTSYSIGGKTTTSSNPSPAIADSGTSLVLVDDDVAKAYYAQVQGSQLSSAAGGYVYPCSAKLPDFGVAIGNSGFIATIPGSDMTYASVSRGTCFGGVQSNSGGNLQIYGDMLLKQYFAVFDGGNKSFGLANKA